MLDFKTIVLLETFKKEFHLKSHRSVVTWYSP